MRHIITPAFMWAICQRLATLSYEVGEGLRQTIVDTAEELAPHTGADSGSTWKYPASGTNGRKGKAGECTLAAFYPMYRKAQAEYSASLAGKAPEAPASKGKGKGKGKAPQAQDMTPAQARMAYARSCIGKGKAPASKATGGIGNSGSLTAAEKKVLASLLARVLS